MSTITNPIYHDIPYLSPQGAYTERELTDVTVDGVQYCRTGHDIATGFGVFMLTERWPHVPLMSDKGLFLFVAEQQMVPLDEWRAKHGQG